MTNVIVKFRHVLSIALGLCLGSTATAALTAPSSLATANLKATSFALKWAAPTGATGGIAGYDIYRDGVVVGSSSGRTFGVTGLLPTTSYGMSVVARDNAGNVSKRFSSGTFPFSKFGGTCPLWNVHSTFDTPDRLLKQVIELPDGNRYFSIAQMVRRPVAPHPQPQPRFAIGLGCEIRHASRLVYATGMDLEKTEGTPIGVNCRLCERENCSQRAEPPITRTLILDENTRRVSSFAFSNAREL